MQALAQSKKELVEVEKCIEERKQVQKSLGELPKKIKHSVMVGDPSPDSSENN